MPLLLNALQAGLDHFPLGGVDHDRHARDVGLGGDQVEEGDHGRLRVQHAFVHVDVDHLGAGFHLLLGHLESFRVVFLADQPGELGRTGDVGALADVDEQRAAVDGERLQAGQATGPGNLRDGPRRVLGHCLGDRLDVRRGGAAAAADDIEEAGGGEFLDHHGHFRRRFVVFAEGVRQAGVGVGRDMGVGLSRQFLDVRPQFLGAEGAVQAYRDRPGVPHRVPEGLGGLARQGAAGGVGDGSGDHDRQLHAEFLEHALDGEDRRLGVEGVEDGLDQDQVGAAFDQAAGRLDVVLHQFVEGDVAVAGVVHVRGNRAGAAGRAEHAGDETRLVRGLGGLRVRHLAGQARPFDVEFVGQRLHAVVGLGHLGGVEGVGLEDVGAGVEVGLLDGLDHVRAAQQQEVVVAFHVARPVGEALAAVVGLFQLVALDHGAHAAIEDQDTFPEGVLEGLQAGAAIGERAGHGWTWRQWAER